VVSPFGTRIDSARHKERKRTQLVELNPQSTFNHQHHHKPYTHALRALLEPGRAVEHHPSQPFATAATLGKYNGKYSKSL
jgi:hypothetical protein